jgi:hypothetical protein
VKSFSRVWPLALALAFLVVGSALGQEATGVIEGVVRRRGSDSGIAGVAVVLSGPVQRNATSDEEGRFTFAPVPVGDYSLRLSRAGFFALADGQRTAVVSTSISQEQSRQSVVAQLSPGSVISGRVLDANGLPLVAANISVFRGQYVDGRRSFVLTNSGSTNDRGEYRLSWLSPGDYLVRAETPSSAGPELSPAGGPTYFGGEAQPERALPVKVGIGQEVGPIDVRLQPDRRVLVSQLPPEPPPGPLRNETWNYYLSLRSPATFVDPPFVRASGGYFNSRVVPGLYSLFWILRRSENGRPESSETFYALTSVDVTEKDTVFPQRLLYKGKTVRGRILVNGSSPSASESIQVQLRDSVNPALGTLLPAQVVGRDGSVLFTDVFASTFWVEVARFAGHVVDLRQAGKSIYSTGKIDATNPSADFEIALVTGGGIVRGKIQSSVPLEIPATVVLVPEPPLRENLTLYRRVATSVDGAFEFTNLAPVGYRVYAFESLPAGAHQSAEYMQPYFAQGLEVAARANGVMTVNPPLSK